MDEEIQKACDNINLLVSFETGKYKVYMHINKQNNKKYVGITCQDPPEKRWLYGCGYAHCPIFFQAIQEFGWDSFEHIILYDNICFKNASDIEQYLIKILKLQNPLYGYNVADGGDANYMLGRHHSKETCEKLSQILYERYATNPECHPWLGRKHTEESKRKMRLHSHSSQKIICVETGEIYQTIREAAQQMGLKSKNSIIIALNNSNKTAKGYHWQRVKEENNNEKSRQTE